MIKKILVFMFCVLCLIGCTKAKDSKIENIENAVNKILTAPNQNYNRIMKSTDINETVFLEGLNEIKKDFAGLIEEKTLNRLLSEQTLVYFFELSYKNDLKIECKSVEVKEQDNYYTFTSQVLINNQETGVSGQVQVNDKGEITHLKFDEFSEMIKSFGK